jgi:hypothetical protein
LPASFRAIRGCSTISQTLQFYSVKGLIRFVATCPDADRSDE